MSPNELIGQGLIFVESSKWTHIRGIYENIVE
jgi:hypothetical protein